MDNERESPQTNEVGDVDANGHLAFGLFTGGILILLIIIYALAQAA